MSAQCFIDLFDSAAFRGERRRIFGPARIEAGMLGLDREAAVSVRVGSHAALRIEMTGSEDKTIQGGEQVTSLDTGSIKSLVVCSRDHNAPLNN